MKAALLIMAVVLVALAAMWPTATPGLIEANRQHLDALQAELAE